jgi:hypothetical protein
LAGYHRARRPALAVIGIPDDNPSDDDGLARPPPGEAMEFALRPDGPSDGGRRLSLMAHAEHLARRLGARLFGKR